MATKHDDFKRDAMHATIVDHRGVERPWLASEAEEERPHKRRTPAVIRHFTRLAVAAGVILLLTGGRWSGLALVASIGAAVYAAAWLGEFGWRWLRANMLRQRPRSIAETWYTIESLIAARCPCCRYSLVGLQEDPDGFTTCAECEAAWSTRSLRAERFHARWTDPKRVNWWDRKRRWITDDRGRPCPLLAARPLREIIPWRRRFWISTLWLRTICFAACATLPGFFVATALLDPQLHGDRLVYAIYTAPLMLGLFLLIDRTHRKQYFPRFTSSRIVRSGRCPACETRLEGQLAGQPSVFDGRLVCERCGSAWNAPPGSNGDSATLPG